MAVEAGVPAPDGVVSVACAVGATAPRCVVPAAKSDQSVSTNVDKKSRQHARGSPTSTSTVCTLLINTAGNGPEL